jgi:hypothetical protein
MKTRGPRRVEVRGELMKICGAKRRERTGRENKKMQGIIE